MNHSTNRDPNWTLTLILYILYIFAIFSAGFFAIIALIINYAKKDAVKGTIFESHFSWQIRTFWWYLFWSVLACVPLLFLLFTQHLPDFIAGIALASTACFIAVLVISWIWIVYRAIRGIIRLNDNKPMYKD